MGISGTKPPVSCRSSWVKKDQGVNATAYNTCSHVPFATYYEEYDHSGLHHMFGYTQAKKGRDRKGQPVSQKDQIYYARRIIESLLYDSKDRPTAFYKTLEKEIDSDCLIVAPSLMQISAKNVLPITFAHVIAKEFGAKVEEHIYQRPNQTKKRDMTGEERLTHDTEFFGPVKKGQKYFLVDDVMTMGGTMAALRGFIERQGGEVIGLAVLADGTSPMQPGKRADKAIGIPFAPTRADLADLDQRFGGGLPRLNSIFKGHAGHDAEELTAREIRYIAHKFGRQGSRGQRTAALEHRLGG